MQSLTAKKPPSQRKTKYRKIVLRKLGRGHPFYEPIVKRTNRQVLLSLRKAAELSGISWPTAIRYSKTDKRVLKYRQKPSPDYPFFMYTYGIVQLFRKMYKERAKLRGPKRKPGRKKKKKNYKWYAGKKIPNWSEPNKEGKHKLNKEIDLTKFSF